MKGRAILAGFCLSFSLLISACTGGASDNAESSAPTLPAQSSEPLHFRDVPYLWSQDLSRFANLWSLAYSQTIRVAVLGDSQETSPEGGGYIYIPRLNYEAWLRFGNVPETQVAGYGSYGGGSPPGEWLLSGAAPGASPTRVAATRMLPGVWVTAHSSTAGDRNINGEWLGQLTILRQDAISVAAQAQVNLGSDYFCTAGGVHAEIFAATHPQSGEVSYKARPLDDALRGDYYGPVSAQGVLSLGLATTEFAVKAASTPQLPFQGHRYIQLEVSGDNDAALTDIVGVRFVSDACRNGLVFQDFAAGGYAVENFLSDHYDAGAMFRAFGFHAAIVHLGANDAGRGVTARMHHEQIKQLIALLRTWVGDPKFPVVLMTDPFRNHWPSDVAYEFDRYAGAHLAIGQEDANVLVVNSRRLMDDRGWNAMRPDRIAEVLVDDVHYTPQGAIELAAAEMATLLGR